LTALQKAGNLCVQYQLQGKVADGQLLLAPVQKNAVSQVKAGENEGRTLAHVQIVRQISTFSVATSKKGTELLSLPAGFDAGNWELIGLVQNSDTGEILAAGKASIANL
jgi:hypothetical protein